jgi:hypothetical protein
MAVVYSLRSTASTANICVLLVGTNSYAHSLFIANLMVAATFLFILLVFVLRVFLFLKTIHSIAKRLCFVNSIV